jgi:hypothetical protein
MPMLQYFFRTSLLFVALLSSSTIFAQTTPEGSLIQFAAPVMGVGEGLSTTIPLSINDVTGQGISSFQFDIVFDPTVIDPSGANFGCSAPPGTVAGNAGFAIVCNVPPGDPVRLKVAAFGFVNPLAGSGTLMNIAITVDPTAVEGDFSPLNFEAVQFFSNAFPSPPGIPNSTTNGQVNILGTTAAAASLAGRIVDPNGRAIGGAIVTVANGSGEAQSVRTNTFGNFQFSDLPVGETYILSASARGFTVDPIVIPLSDSVTDLRVVARR